MPQCGPSDPTSLVLSSSVLSLACAIAALTVWTCEITVTRCGLSRGWPKQSEICPPRPDVPLIQRMVPLVLSTWQMLGFGLRSVRTGPVLKSMALIPGL